MLIKDCNVSNNPGVYGRTCDPSGAIACVNSTTLIDHCTINNNRAMKGKPDRCGKNAGLFTFFSNATLNDTQIEKNEAFIMNAMAIFSSKVEMNRCSIKGNHARSTFEDFEEDEYYRDGKIAGIWINSKSEVSMNDVIIKDNIADYYDGAIKNTGKLNLNAGTVVTGNIAKRYPSLNNTELGMVNMSMGAHIYDNYDKQQPYQPVHSLGILNKNVN